MQAEYLAYFVHSQFGTGWFSHHRLDNLRHRVAIRFLSVYPKSGAEHLLKAITESFEKSKKRCSRDNIILAEEEHPQTSAGERQLDTLMLKLFEFILVK